MDETTYEEKPDAVLIAVYDERYLASYQIPYGIFPVPEANVAEWAEGDPNAHYFFVGTHTDYPDSDLMTVAEYEEKVRAAVEEAEENEVDAPA